MVEFGLEGTADGVESQAMASRRMELWNLARLGEALCKFVDFGLRELVLCKTTEAAHFLPTY